MCVFLAGDVASYVSEGIGLEQSLISQYSMRRRPDEASNIIIKGISSLPSHLVGDVMMPGRHDEVGNALHSLGVFCFRE